MSSYTSIFSNKLSRLIGTANAPTLVDVRIDEDFAANPSLIPGAVPKAAWPSPVPCGATVALCDAVLGSGRQRPTTRSRVRNDLG
jgi:hypothetical protein